MRSNTLTRVSNNPGAVHISQRPAETYFLYPVRIGCLKPAKTRNLIASERSNPVSWNGVPFYERAMRDEIAQWEKPLKGDWANRRVDGRHDLAESRRRARRRRSILPLAFTA